MFLNTFNSALSCIEVWFTDQNSKPLEIEDKVNITLVTKVQNIICKRLSTFVFCEKCEKTISKKLSSKHKQKLLDHAKKSATDAFKTASKRALQKTAEATGDFIGNKITNKIIKVSWTSPQNGLGTVTNEIENIEHDWEIPKERYTNPGKGQKIISDLRLR